MPKYPTDRESLAVACDCEFIRGSGPGGQHRNKRFTGVRLVHRASGEMVTATERREQKQNLEVAFERMAKKLEKAQFVPKRRRPTRPTRGSVERRIKEKKSKASKKANRKTPKFD
jgi:protein subunit release factor B